MSPEVRKIIDIIELGAHRDWILAAKDEHLDEYILSIGGNERLRQMALAERERRHFNRLSKPHWTLTPTFLITVGILIIALATLVVALLSWLFPRTPHSPVGKPEISMTNSALAPTNSLPMTAAGQSGSPRGGHTTWSTSSLRN